LYKVKIYHYTHRTASGHPILSQTKANVLKNTSRITLKLTFHSFTHTLTQSIEQSPSREANRLSDSQKFFPFHATLRFITAFTSVRRLSLSCARSIQSMPQSNFLKIYLNIFSHLCLGFPSRQIDIYLSKIITKLDIFPLNVSRTVMILLNMIGGYQLYSCAV